MLYLMIIIVAIAIIWILYYVISELSNTSKESASIRNGEKTIAAKPHADKQRQQSLDALYACSHGMWVCHRCETLNDGMATSCCACGTHK